MQNLQYAITEFSVPSPRTGSIDTYSGFGSVPNIKLGAHRRMQEVRITENPSYQIERWTTHTFHRLGHSIMLSGRLDGYTPGHPAKIEEIKSAYSLKDLIQRLDNTPDHPYFLQIQTYAYLHYLATGEMAELTLSLVSSRSREVTEYPVELNLETYEPWLERRLLEVITDEARFAKLKTRRKKSAEGLQFPFPEPRPGQMELIESIEKNLGGKNMLILQAPTGLGKTAGVLFPTLREAMSRGDKVVYLTPKNSQHAVAEDAVRRLQKTGSKVRGHTIHAKSKMCFKEQTLCNPEYCEFARDYYKKVSDNDLLTALAKKKNLTFEIFEKMGREFEVCPFELQLDTLFCADVVICDYNYVFSPRNILGRLTHNGYGNKTKGKPNLVIDEAHNLPARANDYFSATIDSAELRELQMGFGTLASETRRLADELVGETFTFLSTAGMSEGSNKPRKVDLDRESIDGFLQKSSELMAHYLESGRNLQPCEALTRLCNIWNDFAVAHDNISEEFFCTYSPSPRGGSLKITCCDASSSLQDSYDRFANVVAFSATLKPFDFYARVLGFEQRSFKSVEFTSPFPIERRKLLIIPQISTKYSDREANYAKIADAITRISALQPGNYFAFFPSFDFLNRVAALIESSDIRLVQQKRDMRRREIEEVISSLNDEQPTLIMAVQGGVFAEGVDYPGEMLIGAFIVGPALPTFDYEREMMREYYSDKFGSENSFDYAYTFPAMAKVVQSAGRVIRSRNDRGLIVLMDRRFLHQSYVQSMPADWVPGGPQDAVSKSVLKDVEAFWASNPAD